MRNRTPQLMIIGLALVAVAGALGAHDTWLLANRGFVPVGGTVSFDMSSGGHFPRNETAILAERVSQSGWRLAGAAHTMAAGRAVTGALRFRETLPAAGVAMFWVSLHPKVLTLKPTLVKEYTDEIGAPAEFFSSWQRATDKTWRERYSKHAKSFVRVGTGASDSSWATRTGQPFELVPLQNPTTLVAGDSLSVLVLRCGRPLAGIAVGMEAGGAGHGAMVKTDASGTARVVFPRPGRWLVNSTYLAYANRVGPLCEQALPGDTVTVGYVSQFVTMTLDVGRRAR
jgi:Domain of unknown function (DUF4198)